MNMDLSSQQQLVKPIREYLNSLPSICRQVPWASKRLDDTLEIQIILKRPSGSPNSDEKSRSSRSNRTLEEKLIQQILNAREQALDTARSDTFAQVHSSGHLTARERLTNLLDPDSFVEYGLAFFQKLFFCLLSR